MAKGGDPPGSRRAPRKKAAGAAEEEEEGGVPYHALDVDEAMDALESSPLGLRKAEAEERLNKVGHNRLSAGEQRTFLRMVWEQLANIITAILIAAAIIAAVFSEWVSDAPAPALRQWPAGLRREDGDRSEGIGGGEGGGE